MENESIHQGLPVLKIRTEEQFDMSYEQEIEYIKECEKRNEREKLIRLESSGVGRRYFNIKLEDYDATTDEQKKALKQVKEFINQMNSNKPVSKTLWLCGKAGTGKTLLASLIIRECGGHFAKSYEIEDDIEISKSFSAKENKKQVLEKYYNYRILVIDEIGKFEHKHNTEIEYLFRILNERYERQYSTILITNKTGKELREYIGIPLYDRFLENCTCIEFTGESYRKLLKERNNE